jgi:hypothetical protein
MTGGSFGSTVITNAVTIVNDQISVDPSATNGLSLTINEVTGEIQGFFVDNGVTNYIESAILQNTNIARGYFASGSQVGSFILLDNYPVPTNSYPMVFTGITNVTMLENASTVTMPFVIFDPLTTSISSVTCTTPSANVSVSVDGTGTNLLVTPTADFAGDAITFTIMATDGNGQSGTTNFTVTVNWVNQVPSFSLAAGVATGVTVGQFDAPVTIIGAVTNISPGLGTNVLETSQTVSFIVTNDTPGLFVVQPQVDTNGTLTFTPGNQGGTVVVGVQAQDNGGTNNNGVDTSDVQMFAINIPVNTFTNITGTMGTNITTGTFAGLFYDTNTTALASSGYFTLTLTNDGTFDVNVVCDGATNTVGGEFNITNPVISLSVANYALDLTLDTVAGVVSGSVSNTVDNWNAELVSYLTGISIITPGNYNLAMSGFDDITAGPTGDSIFNVTVGSNGVATLVGFLADNTPVNQVCLLSATGYCPVYIPLYGTGTNGLLVGWLTFTNDPSNDSVTADTELTWFNVAGATPNLYASGFTNVAEVVGSPYATDSVYSNNLMGASEGSSSIGYVVLSGGDLGADPVVKKVGITNNVISVISPSGTSLSLNIVTNTGMIQGWYIDTKGFSNNIESAIFQNNVLSTGYFIGVNTNQSGLFMLYGN